MERHPWLLRLVQGRLDPATATGLALTLALGLAIVGGLLVGAFAYLVRSSETLVDADRSVGQWGVDHATAWSTDALQLVTELGSSLFIVPATLLLAVVEYRRVPNRWMPVFLLAVVAGEIILVNTIKAILDRVRPDFYEITETLGPSFPSGHSGLAAAFYAARGARARAQALSPDTSTPCSRGLSRSRWLLRAAASSSASTGCRTSSPVWPSAGPGSASARSPSVDASWCSARRSRPPPRSRRSTSPRETDRQRPVRRRRAGSAAGRAGAAGAVRLRAASRDDASVPGSPRGAPAAPTRCAPTARRSA